MESSPSQTPKIENEDPLNLIEQANCAHRQQEISNTPLFRRVLGRLVHPMAGGPTVDTPPTVQEKAISWEASQGYSGVDVTRAPGPDRFRHELLPATEREWRKAVRISRHESHKAAENVDLHRLEKGTYEINPETGKSSWRSADGSLRHVNSKTRRQIKKDEKTYKKLKSKVEGRNIALVGPDTEQPHRAKRTDDEITAEAETRKVAQLKASGVSTEAIKTQEKVARKARREGAEARRAAYEEARAKKARKERNEILEKQATISLEKQRKRALRQQKKAERTQRRQTEESESARNTPQRSDRNYPPRPSARARQGSETIVRTVRDRTPRPARTERGRRYQEQQARNRRGIV